MNRGAAAEAVHDPGSGDEGDEGAPDEGHRDWEPGGAEKREIGDNAHARGDKEKTQPAEEPIGGMLEWGRRFAATENIEGSEQHHPDDWAWDFSVGDGAEGFTGQLEEQQDEDGLDHRHGLRLHQAMAASERWYG